MDGSVVTWGCAGGGGDSRAVVEQLRGDVQHIYWTETAFAAVKGDGSVVTWGDAGGGGNCRAVHKQLRGGVLHIYSTETAPTASKPPTQI